VLATTAGFAVTMVFLLFTVQLLFGLYARTTVGAAAADVARRAAGEGRQAGDATRLAAHEADLRRRLGSYGDDSTVEVRLIDVDSDGVEDTVTVTVVADLPNLLPERWTPAGPGTFTRTARSRLEVVQG
jgi:hypothetical protein